MTRLSDVDVAIVDCRPSRRAAYAAVVEEAEPVGNDDDQAPRVAPPVRIYLAGRITVENAGLASDEELLPSRQGRVLFCYLVLNHNLPLARHDLVNAVWGGSVPDAVDAALNALVSKLRRFLDRVEVDGSSAIESAIGTYQMRLPPSAWVDIEEAELSFHEAEAAARSGDMRRMYAAAEVAGAVARRPFLAGESHPWVLAQRERLRAVLLRTLEFRADFYEWHGEPDVALKVTQEAVVLEPFRETGYQRLMRLNRDQGNRAEALRVYERCRRLLRDELGVSPSAETEAMYLAILKS